MHISEIGHEGEYDDHEHYILQYSCSVSSTEVSIENECNRNWGCLLVNVFVYLFIYLYKYCIFLFYSLHICGGGEKHHHANGKVHSFTQSYCRTGEKVFRFKHFCE